MTAEVCRNSHIQLKVSKLIEQHVIKQQDSPHKKYGQNNQIGSVMNFKEQSFLL